MRHIVFLAFDQALLLDIAGPLQVFASVRDLARARGSSDPYAISVVAPGAPPTMTSSGLAIVTAPLASVARKPIDTLIVVGGMGSRQAAHDAALIRWIARHAKRARRVCSVCTGAFLLAAADLWTASAPPRIGRPPTSSANASRASPSTPTRSSCAAARFGPRPASPPASIWRWRWSRRIWAVPRRWSWRGISSSS